MLQRHVVALGVAVMLLVSGGPAYADTADGPTPSIATEPAEAAPDSVTLPTGDTVRPTDNGSFLFEPAAGREDVGYYSPTTPDGDLLVVPLDAGDEIASGETDIRLFNVDALLRNGYTDARQV